MVVTIGARRLDGDEKDDKSEIVFHKATMTILQGDKRDLQKKEFFGMD